MGQPSRRLPPVPSLDPARCHFHTRSITIQSYIPHAATSECWATEFHLAMLGCGGMQESAVVPGLISHFGLSRHPEHRGAAALRPPTPEEIEDRPLAWLVSERLNATKESCVVYSGNRFGKWQSYVHLNSSCYKKKLGEFE